MDSSAVDGDNVGQLGGRASPVEQVWIIVWDKHAGD